MVDLSHFHPDLRSGPSPGRRLVAVALCALLVLSYVSPGVAVARENDSEGEGSGPSVELPVPPDFDPGGEETGLEESPAAGVGEEEVGAVEPEAEVIAEAPPAEVVTGPEAAPPAELAPPPLPAPAPVSEPAPPESEPVVNETISAPPSAKVSGPDRNTRHSAARSQLPPPVEPGQEEAPASHQPVAAPPAEPARSLTGKDSYVVRPGDCLWHIAAALLPPGADTAAIEGEVGRLWRLNEDRIGTGDPNLIYVGTNLQLR